MKIPEYIKKLLKKREDYAMKYLSCETNLNDWLDKKGIFDECACGEYSCLFNTGVEVFTPGSASSTIEYLENLKKGQLQGRDKIKCYEIQCLGLFTGQNSSV